MAKWVASSVLDNGLNQIKNSATAMLLIKAYSAGDSYATVLSNVLCTIAMTSGDFTISSSGSNRQLVTTSKSGTASASSGPTPNLHVAFTNGTDTVYWVTDESSDQVITSGNPISVPAITYVVNQPT